MRHARVHKWLSGYMDGELPQTQREAIAAHLQRCHTCRREFRRIQEGKEAARLFQARAWQGSERLWTRIEVERRRAMQPKRRGFTETIPSARRGLSARAALRLAVVALLLAANWLISARHPRGLYERARLDWTPSYAFDYGLYLDALVAGEFPSDFDARYESRPASYEQARSETPFRLASFSRVPGPFEIREVRLLKNACCRSVEFICLQNARAVVVFQQPKGHPVTFGRYPLQRIEINGYPVHKARAGKWTVLSWEDAQSHLVAISELNEAQLAELLPVINAE